MKMWRLRPTRQTPQTDSVLSYVKRIRKEFGEDIEIITGYENVAGIADPEEPTRCLVDFSFTVAHGINQIWLTAHITV